MEASTSTKNQLTDILDSFSINPNFLFFILIKYKRVFILIPLILSIIVYVFYKSLPKIYQSEASLIINNDNSNIVQIDQVYNQNQVAKNDDAYINTQIEVLRSNEIINRLVSNPEVISRLDKIYAGTKKNSSLNNFLEKINLVKNQAISTEDQIKETFSTLRVISIKQSNIIKILIKSQNVAEAQFLLSSLISEYLKYDIDQKINITSYANLKINERLDELKKNLEDSELKLQQFKENNQLIDLGDIKDLKTEEIKSLSKRILKAEQELQELQNDLQQIKLADGDYEELSSLNQIREIKEFQNLKANLDSNQTTIDSLLLVYKESHPKVQKALKTHDNIQNDIEQIIQENIAVNAYEIANLENFITLSENELEKARGELQDLELQDIDLKKFTREVSLNERIYQIFLERLKETNEAKELQTSNAKILDEPSNPQSPVYPTPIKNSILFYLLSLFSLIFLGAYYEIFRKSITDPEVLEMNNFETLGVIPKIDDLRLTDKFLPLTYYLDNKKEKFTESVKMMQVLCLAKFKDSKKILFTSPVAAEGKTTVSFNFALSLAEKYKTLYLELDMRRPSLRNNFNIKDKKGFVELFKGEALFSEIILNLQGSSLDIISAGKPQSVFNISENHLHRFIDILEKEYDYIVVDSAPVLPIADTLIISKMVDLVIFVAKSDYTKLSGLVNAGKKIKSVSNTKIASIINNFDTKQLNYYTYSKYGSYYNSYYNYDTI